MLYLAAQPATSFARDHLHGLLWDDLPADSARRNFNTMLSRLQAELPVNCFRGSSGQLAWNPDSNISTDVDDFRRLTATATPEKNDLHRAVALWRGPFADGFTCNSSAYEQWLITERQQWEVRLLTTITTLIALEKNDSRWGKVEKLARKAVHIDPLQEPFHRALMAALFHQGNRSAALAQYARCTAILAEHLGTEPDAATTSLYGEIKTTRSIPVAQSATSLPAGRLRPAGGPPVINGDETADRIRPDHIRDITAAMPPLVGRRREHAAVVDALHRAVRQQKNHLVLVQGEAGIGKTRLWSEIIHTISADDATDFPTLLVGHAYESMLGVPYAAFADALNPVAAAIDIPSLNLADVWLRELGRLLPDVFAQRPDLHLPEPIASGDERLRFFQAIAQFLSLLPQPILIMLDDLHWADPLTSSLLAYLLRYPPSKLRVTAVATVRTGDDTDTWRDMSASLQREGRLTRVNLTNLTKRDTVTLVQTLLRRDESEQAARVYSQTMGHPLHTVELITMLGDSDVVGESDLLPVPPTVQGVVIGRLARLGSMATDVAHALAVFHRGAALDDLCHVLQHDIDAITTATEALLRAHITTENHQSIVSFRHDVFRQSVLDELAPTRRTYLHRQAYAAVAAKLPTTTVNSDAPPIATENQQLLADLIDHAIGGHLWEQGFHWAQRAAADAEKLYAFPLAVNHLDKALMCINELPTTAARLQQRLDIELNIAKLDTWSPPGDRDSRLNALTELTRQHDMPQYMPLIHMARADSLIRQGRCTEASRLLQQLVPLADRDPRLAIGLNAWLGAVEAIVGNVKPALAHLGQVQRAMGKQVLKPGTSIHGGMAACYAAAADFPQADAALIAMQLEEKQQGYETLTGKFLTVAATVEYLRGRWSKAAAYAEQGLLTSRAAEDTANEALSALWLGAATVEIGIAEQNTTAVEKSLEPLHHALAASKRAQTYTRRDFIYAFLSLAHCFTGQPEKAQDALTAGLDLTERFGYMEGRALCTEMQGRMAATRGDVELALRYVTDAQIQFKSLGNIAGVNRCGMHLNELSSGRRDSSC